MSVSARLDFDPTDANSLAASHSVGAYVRAGVDGDLIDSQNINSLEWLNVASALFDGSGNAISSTSGSLDVRPDSTYAEDSAHVSGDDGSFIMGVRSDAGGAFGADGDYVPFSINAAGELRVAADISVSNGHEKAEDAAHVSADIGSYNLSVRVDDITAANTTFLAGTEGDYQSFLTDEDGQLYVTDETGNGLLATIDADTGVIAGDTTSIDATLTALSKAEDAVHGSGDQGIMALAVRNDAETPLAADGDYIPFMMDSSGRLLVSTEDTDDDLANTAIENTATAVSVAAVNVVGSALASRKWLYLANEGNKSLYFGKTGVTAVNGFPLHMGQQSEFRIGPSVTPQIIGGTGASSEDLRVMELS